MNYIFHPQVHSSFSVLPEQETRVSNQVTIVVKITVPQLPPLTNSLSSTNPPMVGRGRSLTWGIMQTAMLTLFPHAHPTPSRDSPSSHKKQKKGEPYSRATKACNTISCCAIHNSEYKDIKTPNPTPPNGSTHHHTLLSIPRPQLKTATPPSLCNTPNVAVNKLSSLPTSCGGFQKQKSSPHTKITRLAALSESCPLTRRFFHVQICPGVHPNKVCALAPV